VIDSSHDVIDFGVPYGMEQLFNGHRSVIRRCVLLLLLLLLLLLKLEHRGGWSHCWCRAEYGGSSRRLAAAGPDHCGRSRGRMLWPLPGVVESQRLDEVIVDRRAVRTGDFAAVIAVEVQSLVRHHQRFLTAVAL